MHRIQNSSVSIHIGPWHKKSHEAGLRFVIALCVLCSHRSIVNVLIASTPDDCCIYVFLL